VKLLRPLLVLALLIGAWELYVDLGGADPLILPAPHEVAKALYTDRSLLWSNFLVSAEEVLAKVTPRASQKVKPPRVEESAVSFECKVYQILDFSSPPHGGSMIIGDIVSIHIDTRPRAD